MLKKSSLAVAINTLFLAPTIATAAPIDFANTPPGSGFKPPRPNVILTLDNSGSMGLMFEGERCVTREYLESPNTRSGHPYVRPGIDYFFDANGELWYNFRFLRGNFSLAGGFAGGPCAVLRRNGTYTALGKVSETIFRSQVVVRTVNGVEYVKPDPNQVAPITTLKNSLRDAIDASSELTSADKGIRLAWQSMHNNGEILNATTLSPSAENSMKVFDASRKTRFLSYLDSLNPYGGTPSHKMMSQAFNYMSMPKSVRSPWAKSPGTQELPYLECRRSYHIFLTDGAWSKPDSSSYLSGEQDGISWPSIGYNPSANWARIYNGGGTSTLADWAFKSWATDLQPSIDNKLILDSSYDPAGSSVIGGVTVPNKWNPAYNPADWQHLVTYTIGYTPVAYKWPSRPTFDSSWETASATTLANNFGGDFANIYNKSVSWPVLDPNIAQSLRPDTPSDLWHTALNGRGRFYPVDTGQRLTAAFTEIFNKITSDTPPASSSASASGSTNVFTDVGTFIAGFDAAKSWKGYVQAETTDVDGNTTPNAGWGTVSSATGPVPKTTADKLDALTEPQIVSRLVLTTNSATNKGVEFAWAPDDSLLSNEQKDYFTEGDATSTGITLGKNRVNFIRGERTHEDGTTYRKRQSRQGDIVNSSIWYTPKNPTSNLSFPGYRAFANTARDDMIYVGGNDGMLHGFSAANGEEKIAYVPKGIMSNLPKLTKPSYSHEYFVDGSPFTGDVKTGNGSTAADWKTMLVGTLGAGGRGYFVLDVTKPSNFVKSKAEDLVVMDKTLPPRAAGVVDSPTTDPDLGHIFSLPVTHESNPMRASQIVRMNNGQWAVVMGNGYNSTNEKPVLYIQFLSGTQSIVKIQALKSGTAATRDTENSNQNGLSAPRLVDINGDDQPDVIYAGDLKGNLWKFDVSSSNPSDWDVAFNGTPLYTAYERGTGYAAVSPAKRQPITAAPTVRYTSEGGGGMMVAFGTGQNLTTADHSSTDTQAIYSVLDNTHYRQRSATTAAGSSALPLVEVHPGESCVGATTGCTKVPVPSPIGSTDRLIQQSTTGAEMDGENASSGTKFWGATKNNFDWTDATVKGWYFNLPASGERLLSNMSFYDGSNILSVITKTPSTGSGYTQDETCSATPVASAQYLTLLNIMNGWPPSVQLMDKNGDGYYSAAADGYASRLSLLGDGVTSAKTSNNTRVSSSALNASGQKISKINNLALMPTQAIRPSWRQLQ